MNARADKRVCLGAFAGAHGVMGDAKLKSFTEPSENVGAYGAVETEDGARRFTLKVVRELKPGLLLVRAPEIKSREDAESLKGVQLFIDRAQLPAPDENEYYIEDLIGLNAVDEAGAALGIVRAVHNFGAGDLIELEDIPGIKGARLLPFTKEAVPEIDLAGGRLTVSRAAIDALDAAEDDG